MADLFDNTSIPILEQMVSFAQTRHTLLAGNIANADTPGYVAQDLSVEDFRKDLRTAIEGRNQSSMNPVPHFPSLGGLSYGQFEGSSSSQGGSVSGFGSDSFKTPSRSPKGILYHDKSQVGLEQQVSEMVKNRLEHNTALAIMSSQFRLLQAAISEKM